jgi:hypothetical protein
MDSFQASPEVAISLNKFEVSNMRGRQRFHQIVYHAGLSIVICHPPAGLPILTVIKEANLTGWFKAMRGSQTDLFSLRWK